MFLFVVLLRPTSDRPHDVNRDEKGVGIWDQS